MNLSEQACFFWQESELMVEPQTGRGVTTLLTSKVNKPAEKRTEGTAMHVLADKVVGAAQAQLKAMLSADSYNLWFAPLRVVVIENNAIQLEVANDLCEVWLKDNYMGLLQDVLAMACGH